MRALIVFIVLTVPGAALATAASPVAAEPSMRSASSMQPPDMATPEGRPGALRGIAFVLAVFAGVCVVFAPEIDMARLRERTTGEELPPSTAMEIAHATYRAAATRIVAAGTAGMIGIAILPDLVAAVLIIGLALVIGRQLWVLRRARHMQLLLFDDARIRLHADHLLWVSTSSASSWLVCTPRQLPTARLV